MPLVLSSLIQDRVPDSIEYAADLNIAVRANGEQRTSFIDEAGNVYPAEIPVGVLNPSFVGLTVAVDGLTPVGFYGYRYVYAAATRYPFVDGGKAMGGSIAPRGNPGPIVVVNMNVDLNYVNLNLPCADRKDVSEIWVYRTLNYTTSADATLAATAGLCFYVGKAVNTPGGGTVAFQDKAQVLSLDQIEFDNIAAPTFKYLRYIPPYFWGIGNDEAVIPVSWNGNLLTITDGTYKWFDGRNGQFASVQGVTTGGIDGRGTFIFKAGDLSGFNQQVNGILTKDGITPETLVPATGTGFITIRGNGSILYRSKFKNPFAWGYTQAIGNARLAQLYAVAIASGDATGIISLPEDQQLKIDFKNPSACYTLNLRLAGSPEFSTTRKLISNYSVSAHASQFYASYQGRKVIWGWDADTFAILQSDGNSQYPISDSIFQTLRAAVRDPYRVQFSHGICDDENELNCLWIPYAHTGLPGESPFSGNFAQAPLTDLCIYQHYPSGKWGYIYDMDLTAVAKIRDLNLDKLQLVGGTHTGLVGRVNNPDVSYNFYNGFPVTPVTVGIEYPVPFFFNPNTFAGVDPAELVGVWGILYNLKFNTLYCRISSLDTTDPTKDILYMDAFIIGDNQGLPSNPVTTKITNSSAWSISPSFNSFVIGGISQWLAKKFDFSAPSKLKKIDNLYLKGSNLISVLTQVKNTDQTRNPTGFNVDVTQFSATIYEVKKVTLSPDQQISINFFNPTQDAHWKGLGPKIS